MVNNLKRILIIDDNPDNIVIMQAMITEAFPAALILTALNGLDGIRLAAEHDPEVILLDVIMPDMDGFTVCRTLKADPQTSDIPIVFVTALKGDREYRILALECGAEAFLSKPVDESELIAQVRAMIKIKTAMHDKRNEKERLARLVEEQTIDLQLANEQMLRLLDSLKKESQIRKESEERYRSIYEQAPLGITISDSVNGRIYQANNQFSEIIGRSIADEHGPIDWASITHIDDLAEDEANMALLNSGKIVGFSMEKRYYKPDGSIVWVNMKITPTNIRINGNPCHLCMLEDITEKKLIEDNLRESEKKYRLLVSQMLQGMAVHEVITNEAGEVVDYRFLDTNPSFERLTGLRHEDIIGKRVLELTPHIQKQWVDLYGQVALTGEPTHYENYAADKDKYFEVEAYSPQKMQFAVIITDITDRKKAELELIASEGKFRAYTEKAPIGIVVINRNGQLVEVNQVACQMAGYAEAELLQMKIEDFIDDTSAAEIMKAINDPQAGATISKEITIFAKDNAAFWIDLIAAKISEERLIAFCVDINERKKNEEKLIYFSYHDQMTGIYNRRYFEEALQRLDKVYNLPITIVMGDLNGLKLVNESFGHNIGDALLKQSAEVIQSECRAEDIVARTGGDEFSVILPKMDAAGAELFISRIKERALQEKSLPIALSISFGYETKTQAEMSIQAIQIAAENFLFKHKLYESTSMRSRTIDLVMSTLFAKSGREMLHSKRVSEICEMLSVKLGVNSQTVNKIKVAGLIHDIGKIGIDETILNKPGKLNSDEWKEIVKHPEIGWRILSSISEFSELANNILEHHERWDGKGYPKGLKGEEISREARIIALADSYDAMTSDRSYRQGLSVEQAVAEIARCSGTQFDPAIATAFIDLIQSNAQDFEA